MCSETGDVQRDSVAFFPELRIFVSRCTTDFGAPEVVAVAVDSSGVLYLLDSPTSFKLVEKRHGRPALDSTEFVDYAMTASRLSGALDWDSRVQAKAPPAPDPRELAPLYSIEGDCEDIAPPEMGKDAQGWFVRLYAASEWSVDAVTVQMIGDILTVGSENLCHAVHTN